MSDFTNDETRALRDIAKAQLELEGPMAEPEPVLLRIVGERRVHRIACRASLLAARTGDDRPACEWVRDEGGYSCTRCATWLGPHTFRGGELARLFGDEQGREASTLDELCAEIEALADELAEGGEEPERAAVLAGATLVLVARRSKP